MTWVRRCLIWRVNIGWYLLAYAGPLLTMLAALGLHVLLGGALPASPAWGHSVQTLTTFAVVLLIGAFLLSGPEWTAIGLTLVSITTHSFWYTWLFTRTGSVLFCVILHGSCNAANRLFVLLPEASLHGGDEMRLLAMMTGQLVATVIGFMFTTGVRLGKSEAS